MCTATASRKSAAAIKRSIRVGDVFDVTNHYITRIDHPSHGTTRRKVVRVNPTGITFDIGGHSYWPAASEISEVDGVIEITGHPKPGDRFLTLVRVSQGDGPACQATPRPPRATNPYPPIESEDAYKIAEKRSKYGHARWVVWTNDKGKLFAARATVENLDTVLAEIGERKAVLFINGGGNLGRREMIEIWRGNANQPN